jgi:hypothetical protein
MRIEAKLGRNTATATAAPRALPPWLLDALSKNGMPQDSLEDETVDLFLEVAEESGESRAAEAVDIFFSGHLYID